MSSHNGTNISASGTVEEGQCGLIEAAPEQEKSCHTASPKIQFAPSSTGREISPGRGRSPTRRPQRRQRQLSSSSATQYGFGFFDRKLKNAPRLVKRDRTYFQSSDKISVKAKFGKHRSQLFWHFINHDPFHVMLRFPTYISLGILLGMWTVFILIFAQIYIWVDRANEGVDCGLHPDGDGKTLDFHTAFAFSVETSTTVGYGLPGGSSAFFQNCSGIQTTIFFQMVFSMVFNASLLAFIYARFSRSETRSHQVLFTRKAVVRKDESGRMMFEVKVFDADAMHPLVEAHVRMYAVHCSTDRNYVPLRLLRPNDELGGTLITSIPTIITHHIDAYSPLMPPSLRKAHNVVRDHGLVLREADSYTGNSDSFICPVCGESYGYPERLLKHINYNRLMEEISNAPVKGTHLELEQSHIESITKRPEVTYDDIFKFWHENNMEVIVVVEAIDPLISGTFQALQSYQRENIAYGCRFVPAFTENNEVDLELFHQVTKEPDPNVTEAFFDIAGNYQEESLRSTNSNNKDE